MRSRKYTQAISISVSNDIYQAVKRMSDQREISLSELFRDMIKFYMDKHESKEMKI